MKKFILFFIVLLVAFAGGCKTTLSMKDALRNKDILDAVENPAKKMIMNKRLTNSLLELKNVLVKDIINSNNIDFDFCVVADVQTSKGAVECYIYAKNVNIISKLEKNKSRINVKGDFGRFFSMLDEYYTKVEIYNASIKIIKNGKAKKASGQPAPVKKTSEAK